MEDDTVIIHKDIYEYLRRTHRDTRAEADRLQARIDRAVALAEDSPSAQCSRLFSDQLTHIFRCKHDTPE